MKNYFKLFEELNKQVYFFIIKKTRGFKAEFPIIYTSSL